MRAIIILGLFICSVASKPLDAADNNVVKPADNDFLQKQKDILRLFKFVFQPNYYKDQAEIGKTFDVEQNINNYIVARSVKNLITYLKKDPLPRGEIFSIFHDRHRKQAVALVRIFVYAKDFDTFYKTACWARDFINEGMFVYAMHAAVLNRQDTRGIVLPPLYEIYPYFFVGSDVIDKAFQYKMQHGGNPQPQKFYINSNDSDWHLNVSSEQKDLSYFTDDVGLNSYYYYQNILYPFWHSRKYMGRSQQQKERRGELFYYMHQQLLAKYYMERLSNGKGNIETFSWEWPVSTGYVPNLRYPNGVPFPTRPENIRLPESQDDKGFTFESENNFYRVQDIEEFESRILIAIEFGYILTNDDKRQKVYQPDGFETLSNIVETNADSRNDRYFGPLLKLARQVLGHSPKSTQKNKIQASALEHFETSLRDPIFYQFFKHHVIHALQKYKNHLPHYNSTYLQSPGVKINKVEVDRLVTFFDNFDFEITNALRVNEEEYNKDNLQVWFRQNRLNHKPFTYNISVESNSDTKVVVRVFIAPKQDDQGNEIPLGENRVNFFEFDKFIHSLQPGKNVIERSSQNINLKEDGVNYRTLNQNVNAALQGQKEFPVDLDKLPNRFPNRFVLPKGKENGQLYQLYVHISPYSPSANSTGSDNDADSDSKPFGFPFDRQIEDEDLLHVPNSYFKDVLIYHK